MPHSTELPPGTIETTFNYIPHLKDGEPERLFNPKTVGYRRHTFEPHTEQVTDIRGHEDEFDVDTHGFQLLKAAPIPEEVYSDDAKFREEGYREVKELLKKATGATHVHIFSHIVRKEPYQAVLDIPKETPDEEECSLQTPAMIAHIDQSYHGAEQVLGDIPDAPQLAPKAKTRWGIINVWRPLKPVTREPLAVCDARSVPDSDLQQVWLHVVRPKDGVPDKVIDVGLWYLQRGEGHKWYWPSEMQPDEALLIKCFDSKKDGRARRAPHSAMKTPGDHGPTRESVEVRCLVFWEDQEKE
ncbi:hypothetical protein M409DRAFT_27019 [Zasmidium cellare ATCC 36951]|uniref:GA4 desaturase family protein n=1 Tax=Zasmidium cellare ATCC 36951 TaxID=1080233 RepID=A0A6A6C6W7_ZASCE|nr:uncharacterized protein M409DRAFT_27019 [Zasmidium cellare ATCC 36951]KAF2162781.1 hypothetical protein M409DRAFT_27019 [Zasmidium cellare ATCC 36951]